MPFLVLYLTQQGRNQLVKANRGTCTVLRSATLKVYKAQRKAARIISTDTFQSRKTRHARAEEAKALTNAISVLVRNTTMSSEGKIDCSKIYPSTSIIPIRR